jgi:hypothetical protein
MRIDGLVVRPLEVVFMYEFGSSSRMELPIFRDKIRASLFLAKKLAPTTGQLVNWNGQAVQRRLYHA